MFYGKAPYKIYLKRYLEKWIYQANHRYTNIYDTHLLFYKKHSLGPILLKVSYIFYCFILLKKTIEQESIVIYPNSLFLLPLATSLI